MKSQQKIPPCKKIVFSESAFSKMLIVLETTPTEVGWHCTVREGPDRYLITDVLVYPQLVTGATCSNKDDETAEKYAAWYESLDDDTYNSMRCHCHSHVNMQPSPSGVDLEDRRTVFNRLHIGDWYIFMIWNKSLSFTSDVYQRTEEKTIRHWHNVPVEIENIGTIAGYKSESCKNVTERSYKWTYQKAWSFSTPRNYLSEST